ncbi:MAG: ABC transporter ATP-binding protein [Candidatus Eisenbacteria bacterium]|nr:ABC transporter ATP-binding protein [Candidatus Eisenbacteria bacterium]
MNSSESRAAPAPAVDCRDVVKRFYYYTHRTTTLREWFIRVARRRPVDVRGAEFVLRGFRLRVDPGEAVALIGPNGSGKSTVLRLIAGIYKPTEGTIRVEGRLAAVMDLGVGFHPELTGTENARVSGAILGMRPAELDRRFPEILAFAEIGDFLDTPVKYYSSGMRARLAFAVSLGVRPDVLLLDEVLAVGDESFRGRCLERLRAHRREGGTLILTSHDLGAVTELCDRAVWLEGGEIRAVGPASAVTEAYREAAARTGAGA